MNSNINLTTAAVSHIKTMLQDNPNAKGIRLGVKASGCSGFSYILDFIKENYPDDLQLNQDGIHMVVDPQSMNYLKGMEIDCVQEGLNKYLKFNNPNVKGQCGCGESFSVEEAENSGKDENAEEEIY